MTDETTPDAGIGLRNLKAIRDDANTRPTMPSEVADEAAVQAQIRIWQTMEALGFQPTSHAVSQIRKAALAHNAAQPDAGLVEIIETRLIGIDPDEQDVVLDDDDWRTILAALKGAAK